MKSYIVFLILLLSSSLRFVGTIPIRTKISKSDSNNQTQYYLSSYIIPQHYSISLTLLAENKYANNFYGRVNITISIHALIQNIILHVEPYVKIRKCILSTKEKPEEIYQPVSQVYFYTQNILVLHFKKEVSPNIYILQIRFKGTYDEGGFLISPYVNETRYEAWSAATYFQSISSRIFPCLDEPAMKATFSITVKHHSNITALSNMPIETILENNNIKKTTFLPTNAIPAHLVGVVLADVKLINNNSSKILNVWYGKQYLAEDIQFAQMIAETVSLYTENKWKKYPRIAKVDHIVIPGLHDNNVQYLGLATYREADIIFNENLTPTAQKVKITRIVSRTMAQQWLNNLVRPAWRADLWLNDGLATLLGIYAVNKAFPELEMLNLFVVQCRHESLHLDSYFMEPLISELNVPSKINSLAAFSRYIKAPVILHMLQYVVTDRVFWDGFRMYFEHQVDSVNPEHFWKSIRTALIKGIPKNKFNVKLIMDAWTKQMHYPVLNAKLDENNLKLTVLLQNVSNYKNWWIPVTFTTETSPNFKRSFASHGKWLKNIPSYVSSSPYRNFTLNEKENGWVIVNLKQAGYYRVNYNYSNWLRITKSLNDKYKYTQIHVLNRAQLLDDSFHFMVTGQLDSSVFWTIATYLKHETNYIAWYPMFKIFEYMSSVFPLQEIKVQEIKKQMNLILDELLKKIGYNKYPCEEDFSEYLKQEAVKWACIVGVPECKISVKHTLKQHLGDHANNKLLPWWKEWIYCKGMMAKSEDDLTLNEILTMLQNNSETKLFEFMSCYGSPKVTSIFLETIIKKPNILIGVQTMTLINNYLLTISKHVRNEEIFQDIITRFETTKPKEVSTIVALINIINHVYSEHQLDQIIEFVKNNAKQLISYTEQKIKIRWSQIECQKSYLTKF